MCALCTHLHTRTQPDPGLTHLTVVEQWNMLCHITILLWSCWILWTRVWSVVEWWQTGGGRSVDDAWHLLRWNMFELSPSVQDYNVNMYISSLENIASDLIFRRIVSLLQDLQWFVLHIVLPLCLLSCMSGFRSEIESLEGEWKIDTSTLGTTIEVIIFDV